MPEGRASGAAGGWERDRPVGAMLDPPLQGSRRQNSLPAIPRAGGFQDEVAQCAGIDAFIRDAHGPLVILSEFLPLEAVGDSRVCFASVGERFPHWVGNFEQPLLSPGLYEAERGAFAVVENVTALVDDEVRDGSESRK